MQPEPPYKRWLWLSAPESNRPKNRPGAALNIAVRLRNTALLNPGYVTCSILCQVYEGVQKMVDAVVNLIHA